MIERTVSAAAATVVFVIDRDTDDKLGVCNLAVMGIFLFFESNDCVAFYQHLETLAGLLVSSS